MRNSGIHKNKSTGRYYIDTTIRLSNGQTKHFHWKPKDEKFKKLNYVRAYYYKFLEDRRSKEEEKLSKEKELQQYGNIPSIKERKNIKTISDLFENFCSIKETEVKDETIYAWNILYRDNIKIPLKNDLKFYLSQDGVVLVRQIITHKEAYNQNRKRKALYIAKELIKHARFLKLITSDQRDDLLLALEFKVKNEHTTESKNKYTSLEDAKKVFEAAENEYMKTIFILLYYSSLRISEFLGIQKGDITFGIDNENEKYAEVKIQRQRKTSKKIDEWLKNGSKCKYIYYFGEQVDLLEKYINDNRFIDSDFIFPISKSTLRRSINKAQKDANVEHNTLHGFGRKSINNELYKKGVDSKARSALLGQESQSVNETHYIDNQEAMKRAKEALKKIK